jgi:hypothetical protein
LFLSQRQYVLSFSSVLACPSAIPQRRLWTLSPSSQLQMVPQLPTHPSTVTSRGCYSTLLSPAPTCLCSLAGVPLHALPLRAAPCPSQVHSSLRQGHSFYWSPHWHQSCPISHDILKCGLGRVP